MSYEEKIMVAAGAASHEDEVKLETKHRAPGGHVYDLEPSSDKSEVTLTEDGADKTTLPLVAEFVGTRTEWNALSATEQSQYRLVHFTDDDKPPNVFSHIGQIIESTTLNTEAKVKAIYGSNTHWISHTGYVLRGATSGITANHTGNDGGADSVTVSSVASHNHTQDKHNHGQNAHGHGYNPITPNGDVFGYYGGGGQGGWGISGNGNNNNYGRFGIKDATATNKEATATNKANGSNYTVNTLPKYKNVYIWERVS